MDLFDTPNNTLRSNMESVLGSWATTLPYSTLQRLVTTLNFVDEDSKDGKIIYPERRDTLRLFRNLNRKNIKAVIIGQDPYYNGNANGYAFGCKLNVSPSLKFILKAMEEDVGNTGIPKDIGLEYLVDSGVFLLNTILTVRHGVPNSHATIGWQEFVEDVIQHIVRWERDIVWMMWGHEARKMARVVRRYDKIFKTNQYVLEAGHPAGASYNGETSWDCTHFSECNDFLITNEIEPIIWL